MSDEAGGQKETGPAQHSPQGQQQHDQGTEGDAEGHDGLGSLGDRLLEQQHSMQESAPQLFSLRKPRDIVSGLASGGKSVLKGVAAGTAALVVGPVVGAAQDGVVGFFKGLGVGLLAVVALPAAGAVVGATQVVRGMLNTPSAVVQSVKGNHWDGQTRAWVTYNPSSAIVLDELARESAAADEEGHEGAAMASSQDREDLYAVLGARKDASPEEIRSHYFKLARKFHPDKNPDDPDAQAKFQLVGKAYQVLGNEESRRLYDLHGTDAVDFNDMMDPSLFFTMLFGSDKFERWIGELKLATQAAASDKATSKDLTRIQIRRIVVLAENLTEELAPWAAGEQDTFTAGISAKAAELVAASYGPTILSTIGFIYSNEATQALGGFSGFGASLKASFHSAGNVINAAKSVAGAAVTYNRLEKRMKKFKEARAEMNKVAKTVREEDIDGGFVSLTKVAEGSAAGESGRRASKSESTTDEANAEEEVEVDEGEEEEENESVGTEDADAAETSGLSTSDSHASPPPGEACVSGQRTGKRASAEDVDAQAAAAAAAAAEDAEAAHAEFMKTVEKEMLPHMLEAMWSANAIDIETTLRKVCRVVLRGGQYGREPVPKEQRALRARGLLRLGQIFSAEAVAAVKRAKAEKAFSGGERVELHGLKVAGLNGRVGIVFGTAPDSQGVTRVTVILEAREGEEGHGEGEGEGEGGVRAERMVSVRPEHVRSLRPVQSAQEQAALDAQQLMQSAAEAIARKKHAQYFGEEAKPDFREV